MNSRLSRLLEKLTPQEQAELEAFAMFVLVRLRVEQGTSRQSTAQVEGRSSP